MGSQRIQVILGKFKTASQDQRRLLGTRVRLKQARQMANTMISVSIKIE